MRVKGKKELLNVVVSKVVIKEILIQEYDMPTLMPREERGEMDWA